MFLNYLKVSYTCQDNSPLILEHLSPKANTFSYITILQRSHFKILTLIFTYYSYLVFHKCPQNVNKDSFYKHNHNTFTTSKIVNNNSLSSWSIYILYFPSLSLSPSLSLYLSLSLSFSFCVCVFQSFLLLLKKLWKCILPQYRFCWVYHPCGLFLKHTSSSLDFQYIAIYTLGLVEIRCEFSITWLHR